MQITGLGREFTELEYMLCVVEFEVLSLALQGPLSSELEASPMNTKFASHIPTKSR